MENQEQLVEWEGSKIPKAAHDKIQQRIEAAQKAAFYQVSDQMKMQLKEKTPGMLDDVDIVKTKLSDVMKIYEERIKDLTEQAQSGKKKGKEPEETPEMLKSKLTAEFENMKKEELKKIRIQGALSETKAAAIAAKLDPEYSDIFEIIASKYFPADVQADQVIFKDGENFFYVEGKPAKPGDVAAAILKKFPKLINTPASGPKLGHPQASNMGQIKTLNSRSKLEAGIMEAFTRN